MLAAMAAHARGAVDLAEGDARAALVALRTRRRRGGSSRRRTRRHGRACWSAWRAARWATTTRPRWSSTRPASVFAELGAAPDLARVESLARGAPPATRMG